MWREDQRTDSPGRDVPGRTENTEHYKPMYYSNMPTVRQLHFEELGSK